MLLQTALFSMTPPADTDRDPLQPATALGGERFLEIMAETRVTARDRFQEMLNDMRNPLARLTDTLNELREEEVKLTKVLEKAKNASADSYKVPEDPDADDPTTDLGRHIGLLPVPEGDPYPTRSQVIQRGVEELHRLKAEIAAIEAQIDALLEDMKTEGSNRTVAMETSLSTSLHELMLVDQLVERAHETGKDETRKDPSG